MLLLIATSVFILYLIILRYVKQEDADFFCKQFYILEIEISDQTKTFKMKLRCSQRHSSEKRGLCSTQCPRETLQNLLYFMYKKTHAAFFVPISCNFIFLPNECPGLCQYTQGHSLGNNIKLHETKTKKPRELSYT
jgi:hypothetical protein